MIKRSFILGLVALAAIAISSCKTTPSDNTTPTDKSLTAPKVGSIFMYNFYEVDSTGAKISGTDRYYGDTVIAVGITYQGRKNVLQAEGFGVFRVLFQFRSYEPNGDVSLYAESLSPGDRGGWITLPLASKGKQTLLVGDTTINGKRKTTTAWFTYTGESDLTLAGKTFHAYSIYWQNVYEDGSISNIGTWWYDAATGILLKMTDKGVILELTGYNPK